MEPSDASTHRDNGDGHDTVKPVVGSWLLVVGCRLLAYLKWSADSRFSFGRRGGRPPRLCGMPYLGLMSWQPFSQYTPPSADSGGGIGEFTAISRSRSK